MNIKISDRTLCGGANSFSFKEKIEIARQLEKLCVDTVEFEIMKVEVHVELLDIDSFTYTSYEYQYPVYYYDNNIDVVGNKNLQALFAMTPYYWRTSKDDAKKLDELDALTTDIDIIFSVYRKN